MEKRKTSPSQCNTYFYQTHLKHKHLFKAPGCNHKVHPFHSEAPAQLNCLDMALSCPGEG